MKASDLVKADTPDLKPEHFMFQAECIRRQVEKELDGESDGDLLYFFHADEDVTNAEMDRFTSTLADWDLNVIVYHGDIRAIPEDEMRESIKQIAPEVGLRVEELDD